jgi:methylmalonyl-CoA mutase cobalamin-binding domain/chain
MSQISLARQLKDSLENSVEKSSEAESLEVARRCLETRLAPDLLIGSISEAFKAIGDKFETGVYYLPELLFAGTVAQKVLEILGPILSSGGPSKALGKVVIGTVRGDIHDLGKNIVSLMLRPEGFRVIDLGTDVSPEKFAETVASEKANILCMSALLSTTRGEMRLVVQELKKRGLRDRVKVIVGGGAVDKSFAKEVGADDYGKDAIEAVKLCKRFPGS